MLEEIHIKNPVRLNRVFLFNEIGVAEYRMVSFC